MFKNSYVLTARSTAMAPEVVDAIRPIRKRFGGICLVSDAHWIVH